MELNSHDLRNNSEMTAVRQRNAWKAIAVARICTLLKKEGREGSNPQQFGATAMRYWTWRTHHIWTIIIIHWHENPKRKRGLNWSSFTCITET